MNPYDPDAVRSTLTLRRAADGTTRIQGEPPAEHIFPTSFIARELGRAVSVRVTVATDGGPVHYDMVQFEPTGDPDKPNVTGWHCRLVGGEA